MLFTVSHVVAVMPDHRLLTRVGLISYWLTQLLIRFTASGALLFSAIAH